MEIKSKSYTLRTETGNWLGQIVLTSDGMFASVTDWGNFSNSWRHYGDRDFREFICSLNFDYFSEKIYTGISYIAYGEKIEKSCKLYTQKILPVLQSALKEDLLTNPNW